MPSYNMHLAFAKIINEKLKMNEKDLLIGTLAADMCAKGFEAKRITHFGDVECKVYLDRFLSKYKEKLDNAYVMGYFIHIYLDYVFFEKFLSNYYELLEGSNYSCKEGLLKNRRTGEIIDFRQMYGKSFYDTYQNIKDELAEKYNIEDKYNITKEDIQRYNIIDECDSSKLINLNDELNSFDDYIADKNNIIYTFEEFDEFINKQALIFIDTYCKY